jgi:hypothetical protein
MIFSLRDRAVGKLGITALLYISAPASASDCCVFRAMTRKNRSGKAVGAVLFCSGRNQAAASAAPILPCLASYFLIASIVSDVLPKRRGIALDGRYPE